MKKKIILICSILALALAAAGCSSEAPEPPASTVPQEVSAPEEPGQQAEEATETGQDAVDAAFSFADIPAYAGAPYAVINGNHPFFGLQGTGPFESYSPLDGLGRCGAAYACVGQETMPTEKRGKIGQVKPSGWHTVKYDFVDGKYLYNRCHLIGYQLTAENANERNLITGTRYMNVEGMLPFENMVADYVHETNNHVLYRVTPVFNGDSLVAAGVLMEAESVEDGGAGILYNVFVYNIQPGVEIDYATGESWLPAAQASTENEGAGLQEKEVATESTYILNTNTKKFHTPECSSVADIKDGNKQEYTGTRDEIIAQGYEPCGRCHP